MRLTRHPSERSYRSVNWQNPINWNHPLNKGLIAWYLNVPHWQGGTVFRDLAGRYDGTLTTMDPVNDWVGPQDRPGGWGALDLDGVNDHVVLAASMLSADIYTICIWVHFNAIDYDGAMFSIYTSDSNAVEFFVNSSSGRLWGGAFDNKAESAISSITTTGWYRCVLTSDGTTLRIYLNGRASGPTGTASFSTFTPVGRIGQRGASFPFNGPVDDVRVYDNRFLTAAEVALDYQLSQQFYPGLLNRRGRRAVVTVAVAGPITGRHYPRGVMRGEMRGVA